MTQDVLKYLQPNAAIPIDMETTSLLVNALKKALADHAMRETQRIGQEIEQEPKIGCVNHDCDQCKAQPEQEPVAWMDADGNVSDNNDHKCFPIPLYTKEQP